MSDRLSKQHFWEWFQRHNTDYIQFHKKSKKEYKYLMSELNAHLRAHGRYMKYVLDVELNGESGILTITSLGKSKYFDKIDAFVAKAPKIPGWEIVALEPSQPIDFLPEERCSCNGIDIDQLFFKPIDDSEVILDIIVYHPLHTWEEHELFERVAKAAIYNLLGERSFGLDIGWIDVSNLSDVPEGEELLKLEALPAYMDSRKSSWRVDASGKLQGYENI